MLNIKRGKSANNKNSAMFDFFQSIIWFDYVIELSSGKLGEEFDKDMSFRLNVSSFRRRRLL